MKITVLLIILLLTSCQHLKFPDTETLSERDQLRDARSPLDGQWLPADQMFHEHYGIMVNDIPGAEYYPVWFDSLGEKMNAIIFTPMVQSRGTILAIHGYAGNIRGFKKIVPALLKEGFTVAALSLPGHGIADGARGDIDSFNDYGELVNDFLLKLSGRVPEPISALTHSTGSSALLIYNQKYDWSFQKVIFLAPLIRSRIWYPSVVARFFTKPFVHYINTSWTGPLAVQVFPLHWFDELKKFNKDIKKYTTQEDKILLLQGTKDAVVDWRYNVKFIQDKYPNTEVYKYDGGSHMFFMDSSTDRELVIEKIVNYLCSSS